MKGLEAGGPLTFRCCRYTSMMHRRSVAFLTFRDPSIKRESIDVLQPAASIAKAACFQPDAIDNHDAGLNGYTNDGTRTRRPSCFIPREIGDLDTLPTTSSFPCTSQNLGRQVNAAEAPNASTPNTEAAAGMTEEKHRRDGAHSGRDNEPGQALENGKVGGGTTSSKGCDSDFQHTKIDLTAAFPSMSIVPGSPSPAFNIVSPGTNRGGAAVNSRTLLTGAKSTLAPRSSRRFSPIPGTCWQRDLRDSGPGDEDAPRIEDPLDFFAGGGGPEGCFGGGVCRASSV